MHLRQLKNITRKADNAKSLRASGWDPGGLSLARFLRRLFDKFNEDELATRSAALSFYFLFSLLPIIFALMAILGMFAQNHDVRISLLNQFGQLAPGSALALVERTFTELSIYSNRWKLVFGVLLAVWSGSGGMRAIMAALNRCHRATEARPYWMRIVISIALTSLISALTLIALAIVLGGGDLAAFVGSSVGLSRAAVRLWQLVEWPVALIFVLFSLALVYYFGPDIKQRWRWVTPGSVVGVAAWVGASLLFRAYLQFFNTYRRSYGSLGAVMVLLLWLYMTGLSILLGGEINATIGQVRAEAGTSR
jgi:membrane protein